MQEEKELMEIFAEYNQSIFEVKEMSDMGILRKFFAIFLYVSNLFLYSFYYYVQPLIFITLTLFAVKIAALFVPDEAATSRNLSTVF
jgi:hypothetical protein